MIFIGQEELGRTGFRCELSRGEIIELTLRSLFPDMEQKDMIALREAIDYGINNYQSSHSSVSCGWGRSYSPYFTDSTTGRGVRRSLRWS